MLLQLLVRKLEGALSAPIAATQAHTLWLSIVTGSMHALQLNKRPPNTSEDALAVVVLRLTTLLQTDEQDAEERAELRRKQIEAANKMLYDDTDRPKKLHSKMLLSDVMQERVAQMDYAQQIKALKHNQDTAFLVQQAARLKVILDRAFK